MRISTRTLRFCFLTMEAIYLLASSVSAAPCEVPDNGSGTAGLPPAGCEYEGDTSGGSNDKYVITEGLPPGTTIEMVPIHTGFTCDPISFSCSVAIPGSRCEGTGGGGLAATPLAQTPWSSCRSPERAHSLLSTGLCPSRSIGRHTAVPVTRVIRCSPSPPKWSSSKDNSSETRISTSSKFVRARPSGCRAPAPQHSHASVLRAATSA
jgi:hypothetical protein